MSQQGVLETPPSPPPPPPLLAAPREKPLWCLQSEKVKAQLWVFPTGNTSPSCSSNSPVDPSPQCPIIKDEDSEVISQLFQLLMFMEGAGSKPFGASQQYQSSVFMPGGGISMRTLLNFILRKKTCFSCQLKTKIAHMLILN